MRYGVEVENWEFYARDYARDLVVLAGVEAVAPG